MARTFILLNFYSYRKKKKMSQVGKNHLPNHPVLMSHGLLLFSQFREGDGTPLQYSGLEKPMDRGAW